MLKTTKLPLLQLTRTGLLCLLLGLVCNANAQLLDSPVSLQRNFGGVQEIFHFDVNEDGIEDIMARTGGILGWFEGLGEGYYGERHDIAFGSALHDVDLADLDGDGDLDVIVSQTTKLRWHQNLGSGNFAAAVTLNSTSSFNYCAAGDMDNDGDADIIEVTSIGGLRLHENLGGGSFAFYTSIESGAAYPQGVVIADLDDDGLNDILTYSSTSDQLTWNKNLGGLTVSLPSNLSTTISGDAAPLVRDMDADGDLDVLAVNNTEKEVVWVENLGAGSFATESILITFPVFGTKWYQQLRMADMDADGDDDLLISDNYDGEILYFTNDGTSSPAFTYESVLTNNLDGATDGFPIDLDADGDLDLITASEDDDKLAVLRNLGGNVFGEEARITFRLSTVESIQAIDMDNDGDKDLMVGANGTDRISWIENYNGHFTTERVIFDAADWVSVAKAGDLDGDGDMDVVATYGIFSSVLTWYENLGGGIFGPENTLDTYSETRHDDLQLADLDGDGDLDPLMANSYSDEITWYRNLGGGNFSSKITIASSITNASDLAAIDTDGDGDLDVVCAITITHEFFHFENLGGGNFIQKQYLNGLEAGARDLHPADLDNDGDIDLAIISLYFNGWLENVGGLFQNKQGLPGTVDDPQDVATTDLDQDGYQDIIYASEDDDRFYWIRNLGGGNFGPEQLISDAFNGPFRVVAADLDDDGDEELIVSSRFDGSFSLFENLSQPPCLTEPVNLIHTFVPGGIEFYWDEVESATAYQLRIRRTNAPKKSKYFFPDSNIFTVNAAFPAGDEYRWLVRAKCGTIVSPWSTFDFISIPGSKLAAETGALFPNPASEVVYLTLEAGSTLQVFDLDGKMIYEAQQNGTGQMAIPVSTWKKGSYLFSTIDEKSGETRTQLFIKE